jgi:hypothetical protein
MAFAVFDFADSLARWARSQASRSSISGRDRSLRTARRCSAEQPLISRSIANSRKVASVIGRGAANSHIRASGHASRDARPNGWLHTTPTAGEDETALAPRGRSMDGCAQDHAA